MKRMVVLITVGMLCSLGLAAPVLAASPGNDTYAGRTVVDTLPFSDDLDTTEATTDALDSEAGLECGAPAIDASVWYELSPAADGAILIDANESDYAVGILVVAGDPGGFALLACGPGSIAIQMTAGETLTILVFDYDEVGNGGHLALSIAAAPPPPTIELTVARSGSIDQRTGVATISGTITCVGGGESGKYFLEASLTQQVGRFRIDAYGGGASFACDGTVEAWAIELIGENGRLGGGKATVTVFAVACTYVCSTAFVDRVVTLSR